MDSSNTIKEFFENQGAKDGIEHNIRSGDSWSYLLRCPLDGGGTDCFAHCRKGEA